MTAFLTALGATEQITANTAPLMGMVNRYNAAGGSLSITLPALAGLNVGANCVVSKDILDVSTNTVTFTRSGSDVFDDSSTGFVLTTPGSQVTLQVVEIAAVKVWKIMDYGAPAPDVTLLVPKSTLTTKGDLFVRDNTGAIVRLAAGADGTVLSADSAQAKGLQWIAAAGAVILQGAYASLPAAGTANRLYVCTDTDLELFDNGSAWEVVGGGSRGPAFTLPPTSGWSTTTLGSATFAADKSGRLLTIPDASGANFRVEYRTLTPTSNYTFTIYIEPSFYNSNYCLGGIFLRQSSDGKMVQFGPVVNGTSFGIQSWKITSPTAYSTQYGAGWNMATGLWEAPHWFRFRDDGTNRHAEFSNNGLDWITYHSVGRTDFLTADQVGWGADQDNSGFTSKLRLRSWLVA